MTARAELRWIVPGELPVTVLEWLAPRRAPEHRVDLYLLDRLRPDLGAKRRNGNRRRVEVKEQVGHSVPLVVGPGCTGLLQQWQKHTVLERASAPQGGTIAVAKQRWRRNGLEAVELEVEGARSWSFALEWRGPAAHALDVGALLADADRLLAEIPVVDCLTLASSCSYPQWLVGTAITPVAAATSRTP